MIRALLTTITLGLVSITSPGASGIEHSLNTNISAKEELATNNATATFAEKQLVFDDRVLEVYNDASLKKSGLSFNVFRKAFVGFQNFKQRNLVAPAKSILTVIDFTKPSSEKRMWIIDLKSKKVLFNTLVAHGRNTGQATADKFSNLPNSNMSSVGFYLTDETYFGKHGLSLKLDGMDEGYNDKARERAIVVHGADYVSDSFVKQYGRLGRSLGCPALPQEISKEVIETIKDHTLIYINGNNPTYTSNYLNQDTAIEAFASATAMPALSI
ncbi:murein L,D-transpeptidase catalytic domain family protein [Pontibacter arcticus]|uniref:L,D-transpeptidase catalytic domain n=1 Tax=Pontibacter arcticus TaxID=2080288 RepID=A0A364RCC9_9BACT|nr:murein L,D-transpeptidase catalytic domain family protein [Pontibacter arcticus]RAU81998.1 hypothetical protein DP923_15070 [Pontibacter arcticus]